MNYTTLVSSQSLLGHLTDPDLAIIDCRFDLEDPDAGLRAYQEAHIPGAIYAHLEQDLSAPMTGRNGRHPLPAEETLAALFYKLGDRPRRAGGGL